MQDKLVFLLQELHSDLKFHNELFKLRFDQSKFRSICKKGTKMWHSTQEDIPSAVLGNGGNNGDDGFGATCSTLRPSR